MEKTKKFSLSGLLLKLDCETLALICMALMAVQPLYGVFDIVRDQNDLIALFYGKATVIRFVGICGLLVGVIHAYQCAHRYGEQYFKKKFFNDPWNLIFLVFLVWSVFTSITAQIPEYSFFSYAYRYEGLLSYFAYAGIYVCGSLIRSEDKRRRLIDFLLIVAAVLAIVTFLSQMEGNEDSILVRSGWVGAYSGTFINTNHYGYFLCIILMLSAGRLEMTESLPAKVLFIASFLLNTAVLLKNNSFGPYLAVSVGLVGYFIVVTVRDGIRKSWWLAIPFAIFFAMDAATNGGAMIRTYGTIWNEFLKVLGFVTGSGSGAGAASSGAAAAGETIADAGSGRMGIWMAAFDVFKKYPVIGCGPENVPMQMNGVLGSYEAVHNEYLQVLAEMGIVGLLLFLGGHVSMFVNSVKRMRKTSPASLVAYGAVAAYLVSAAFGITITVSEVFMFFVMGLANASHNTKIMDDLEAGIK